MPKNDESTSVANSDADAFEQTVEEFCSALSKTDRSVEMIGAFYASEKKAGRLKDLASNYAGRYAAFKNQPA